MRSSRSRASTPPLRSSATTTTTCKYDSLSRGELATYRSTVGCVFQRFHRRRVDFDPADRAQELLDAVELGDPACCQPIPPLGLPPAGTPASPATSRRGSGATSVSVGLPFVDAYQSGDALGALGDPTRRAILACLAERPRAVGELAEELPVSRPAVSQHLKVLKSAGLVTERAAGTRRIYRLNPAGVAALRDQLETFWNRALAGYQDLAGQPEVEEP